MANAAADISAIFKEIIRRIQCAYELSREVHYKNITLVAVSKTKPIEDVIKLYKCGQRHFGENYVKELESKSNDSMIIQNCKDIKWHFIGHLQKNKINKLLKCPNLYMVESLDSISLAEHMEQALNGNVGSLRPPKLKVLVQVNTSGEKGKSGVGCGDVSNFAKYILQKCPHLDFNGLMTIGSFESSTGRDDSRSPNPDFLELVNCRRKVCEELDIKPDGVDLSMGMSHDFEHAISMGATYVRVGSAIFGPRN